MDARVLTNTSQRGRLLGTSHSVGSSARSWRNRPNRASTRILTNQTNRFPILPRPHSSGRGSLGDQPQPDVLAREQPGAYLLYRIDPDGSDGMRPVREVSAFSISPAEKLKNDSTVNGLRSQDVISHEENCFSLHRKRKHRYCCTRSRRRWPARTLVTEVGLPNTHCVEALGVP